VWIEALESTVGKSDHAANWTLVKARTSKGEGREQQPYIGDIARNVEADLVLVDGTDERIYTRVDFVADVTLKEHLPRIIVVDDTWRQEYRNLPNVLKTYKREIHFGLGPARRCATQTDIWLLPT
jgi:hypothetical protein